MKKVILLSLVVAGLGQFSWATVLIGRSGSVLKPNSFFVWSNFGYNKWAKAYDWSAGKYVVPQNFLARTNLFCDLLVSYGLPGKFDVGGLIPIAYKTQGSYSSFGLGDMMLLARYGALSSPELPLKLALAAGVNVPTAGKNALPPLGDRTLDVGLGVSAHTTFASPFTGHGRLGYWWNGKADSVTQYGRMVEYALILDYAVSAELVPELAVSGLALGQTRVRGRPVANTEVQQHVVNLLLMWKPIGQLVVRPKLAVPLEFLCKGSTLAAFYLGLDIWATIP